MKRRPGGWSEMASSLGPSIFSSWGGWDWVQLVRRPLIGLLYQTRMMMMIIIIIIIIMINIKQSVE
jgi:uncharacterized membrane protein